MSISEKHKTKENSLGLCIGDKEKGLEKNPSLVLK